MPELAAVAEAPVIDSPETTEAVETTETPSAPETEAPESTEAAPVDSKEDGRQFAGKLRDHYKELMASNDPNKVQLAKAVKDLFFQNKALKDKFPGGIKEVEELKANYEKYGTPEEIEEIRTHAAELEAIDNEWTDAPDKLIARLTSDPERIQRFKEMVPAAIDRLAQVDLEGYQRKMSDIISRTFQQANFNNQLYLINYALSKGDTTEAQELVKGIGEWVKGIEQTAKSVPASPSSDPRQSEYEAKAAQLEEQKAEFFNTQLANEVNGWRDSQIKSALSKLTNGQKIDPERLEIFNDRVVRELVKMQPQDFKDKWTRLYAQGDKAALVKFVQGFESSAITKAVSKVHALLFPSNGAKKAPVTVPAAQPTAKPVEAGWVKIPQRPSAGDIDRGRGRTTDEMIFAGKAILRSGKKVMWDRA